LIFGIVKHPYSGVRKGQVDVKNYFQKKRPPTIMRLTIRFLKIIHVSPKGVSWNKNEIKEVRDI